MYYSYILYIFIVQLPSVLVYLYSIEGPSWNGNKLIDISSLTTAHSQSSLSVTFRGKFLGSVCPIKSKCRSNVWTRVRVQRHPIRQSLCGVWCFLVGPPILFIGPLLALRIFFWSFYPVTKQMPLLDWTDFYAQHTGKHFVLRSVEQYVLRGVGHKV